MQTGSYFMNAVVDVFVVCLLVVFWSSGFYHLKAASEADTGGSGPGATTILR